MDLERLGWKCVLGEGGGPDKVPVPSLDFIAAGTRFESTIQALEASAKCPENLYLERLL